VFDIELVFFFHFPFRLAGEVGTRFFLFLLVGRFIFFGFLYEENSMS